MEVKVASCSVAQLFIKGVGITASDKSMIKGELHLPEYQRPYRWKEEQLKRLLKDLKSHFVPPPNAPLADHDFYMGSIILHQQQINADKQLLNIIDGQQRLTTLALIAFLQKAGSEPSLSYESPISQNQICKNLKWLQENHHDLGWLDLAKVNITLVVTHSEDDAYRFFETQNTGGVRLGGVDIIKAHHLRATPQSQQNEYAKQWESFKQLDILVGAILKARYWRALDFRNLPSYRASIEVKRKPIVNELGDETGQSPDDRAYQAISIVKQNGQSQLYQAQNHGYAMCQPLNAGINTIHYLQYFYNLRQQLLIEKNDSHLKEFYDFYHSNIFYLKGCDFLKDLFESTVLLYVSQFGTTNLYEASLWLFRVTYSPRVIHQRSVREDSIPKLVKESPVFDWILMSYNHEQCIERLKNYTYEISTENIERSKHTYKSNFVDTTIKELRMQLLDNNRADFDKALVKVIELKIKGLRHD